MRSGCRGRHREREARCSHKSPLGQCIQWKEKSHKYEARIGEMGLQDSAWEKFLCCQFASSFLLGHRLPADNATERLKPSKKRSTLYKHNPIGNLCIHPFFWGDREAAGGEAKLWWCSMCRRGGRWSVRPLHLCVLPCAIKKGAKTWFPPSSLMFLASWTQPCCSFHSEALWDLEDFSSLCGRMMHATISAAWSTETKTSASDMAFPPVIGTMVITHSKLIPTIISH